MTTRPPEESGRRPMRILIAVWLGLISAYVALDHVALSKLKRDTSARAHDMEVAQKLADLEQRVDAMARQPASASLTVFTATRQAFDDRLAKVEQLVSDHASIGEVVVLQDRLNTIETRLSK